MAWSLLQSHRRSAGGRDLNSAIVREIRRLPRLNLHLAQPETMRTVAVLGSIKTGDIISTCDNGEVGGLNMAELTHFLMAILELQTWMRECTECTQAVHAVT